MDTIIKYNKLIEEIVKEFWTRFYKEIFNQDFDINNICIIDYQWIKHMIEISDEYYSIDDILIAELYQIPIRIVQKHYNLGYEASLNDKPLWINLYNYWRKETNLALYEKEEKESLKRSEENVAYAKAELEKVINKN